MRAEYQRDDQEPDEGLLSEAEVVDFVDDFAVFGVFPEVVSGLEFLVRRRYLGALIRDQFIKHV